MEKNLSEYLKIVLVETETPGNLGASARAMKTMGFHHLTLVRPYKKDSREAWARAVHAQDILEQAQVCDNLESALTDCTLVIGTSGKIESVDQKRFSPRTLAEYLRIEIDEQQHTKIAIVFGRESKGLTLSELSLCHAHIRIPTHPDCPSLNLGAAVQLICYELFVANLAGLQNSLSEGAKVAQNNAQEQLGFHSMHNQEKTDIILATQAQQNYLLAQLENLAIQVGALNPKRPRQMMTKLRTFIYRAQGRKAEIDLLINLVKRALKSS